MSPRYEPILGTFELGPGTALSLAPLKLERSCGNLESNCEPAGATFELREGDEVVKSGTFPASFENLPTGEYLVVARFNGREETSGSRFTRNDSTRYDVAFASGAVKVISEPSGAEILIDGSSAGRTPLDLSLAEGRHRLAARYRKWPEQHRTIEVGPAQPREERFEFLPGSVKITTAPGGAWILADGKKIGRTPWLVENVDAGEVRYELQLTGYQSLVLQTVVPPGEQTFLGARLVKHTGPQPFQPWENSLGMRFVPVEDVLMGVWPVRVKDYGAFCEATARGRPVPDFHQDDTHPVVRVNWADAAAFCEWLTQTELDGEQLAEGQHYRLPTDVEWSRGAGLPDEGGSSPQDRDGKVKEFAWGKHWPPPAGAGNFADQSLRSSGVPIIAGYHDGFPQTAPVGSFPPNKLGLYDFAGNVWQWCLEPYRPGSHWGVLRGGSWANARQSELYVSCRNVIDRSEHDVIYGFRVVLVPDSGR